MNIIEQFAISPNMMAEMEAAVDRAEKGIRDPQKIKEARESMDCIREQIRREHGVLDIGLPAIRELRDS